MEPLQIVGDADQRPFPRHGLQSTQQELAEAHHLFDDAKHRFHRGFAPCVDRLAFRRLQPVAHPHHRTGRGGGRLAGLGETGLRAGMVRFAAAGQ